MPSVLPHQGRREGERAAAGVREGEKGRWRRRKQIEEKGKRRRRGGQGRRREGGVFNYLTACSIFHVRGEEYIVIM